MGMKMNDGNECHRDNVNSQNHNFIFQHEGTKLSRGASSSSDTTPIRKTSSLKSNNIIKCPATMNPKLNMMSSGNGRFRLQHHDSNNPSSSFQGGFDNPPFVNFF